MFVLLTTSSDILIAVLDTQEYLVYLSYALRHISHLRESSFLFIFVDNDNYPLSIIDYNLIEGLAVDNMVHSLFLGDNHILSAWGIRFSFWLQS